MEKFVSKIRQVLDGLLGINGIDYEIAIEPTLTVFTLFYTTRDRDDLSVLRFMHAMKDYEPIVLTVENEYVEVSVKLDLGIHGVIKRVKLVKDEGKETVTVDTKLTLEALDAVMGVHEKLKDVEDVKYYIIDQGDTIRITGIPVSKIES